MWKTITVCLGENEIDLGFGKREKWFDDLERWLCSIREPQCDVRADWKRVLLLYLRAHWRFRHWR